MILYLSGATAYEIYNREFEKGLIIGGYQAQKFNFNIIKGLSQLTDVVSLSSVYYGNFDVPEAEETYDDVRYICIRNYSGFKHKFLHIKELISKGKKIIKDKRPDFIICDAISLCHTVAALYLANKYNIPSVGIVTDVPEVNCSEKIGISGKMDTFLMKRFSLYVLLTESMNEIVNPQKRPFVIMEGSCDFRQAENKNVKTGSSRICLYGGSLWENNAGIENLVNGFIKANIPDCELHFFGTGALEEWLKNISEKHSNIKYNGCVKNEELVKLQTAATLLVNPRPSDKEFCKYSFPSKTFEYMASGTPVLMTKLPGIPEEYFDFVYTIENETADGICKALKDIFSLSPVELESKGKSAQEFILKNKNNFVQAKKIWEFLNANI